MFFKSGFQAPCCAPLTRGEFQQLHVIFFEYKKAVYSPVRGVLMPLCGAAPGCWTEGCCPACDGPKPNILSYLATLVLNET